ncbi:hypothetical protein F5Y08DRAFT_338148 [Xylaria arbuscula]|uniref:Glycan binding protein Y3-like domain-containing protein n=1 Tax=Xylaria arbuscula TaxID=114810 RepID=A0A9W8NKP6_9PEZI|nr:hypothetical protein F5Y08DRAFT_338148 [Xylaria arbuscula]KAJ3578420.1 hypothetical protein NPX13_g2147 [Xylaria arbuscula]
MYPYTILVALFAFLEFLQPVSAGTKCYNQGLWGNYGTDIDKMDGVAIICKYMAGFYVGWEKKTTCFQIRKDFKWDFTIRNLNDYTKQISAELCEWRMSKLNNRCGYGGQKGDYYWHYWTDPNYGNCIGSPTMPPLPKKGDEMEPDTSITSVPVIEALNAEEEGENDGFQYAAGNETEQGN